MTRIRFLCLGLCLVPLSAGATEFYVDPVHGSPTGDGSAGRPWRTIQEVFDGKLVESQQWDKLPYTPERKLVTRNTGAPVRAGDTIRLRSGYHGDLLIDKYYNLGTITLTAEEGHTPRLSSLHIRSGAHWTIRGLSISAEFSPKYERHTLVHLESHGWGGPVRDIVVEDCAIASLADASAWTAQDWDRLSCSGIQADGTRMTAWLTWDKRQFMKRCPTFWLRTAQKVIPRDLAERPYLGRFSVLFTGCLGS